MANGPSFDPNFYNDVSFRANHRNRCLTDLYEPGSTFKIIPVGAALNEKILKVPRILLTVQFRPTNLGRKRLRLPKDHHPLGKDLPPPSRSEV